MPVQLARSSANQSQEEHAAPQSEMASFEDALRHDFVARRIISYESVVGGVGKRSFDLGFAILTAPLWVVALLIGVLTAMWRASRGVKWRVLTREERVGYAARPFKRWRLNLSAPLAETIPLFISNEQQSAAPQPDWRLSFAELIQRLPEMFNVLSGDMSLVGPRPVSHQVFEDLHGARRYYASARPGWASASDCGPADEWPSLYRFYAKHWSMALDWRIIRQAFKLSKILARP